MIDQTKKEKTRCSWKVNKTKNSRLTSYGSITLNTAWNKISENMNSMQQSLKVQYNEPRRRSELRRSHCQKRNFKFSTDINEKFDPFINNDF